MSELQENYLDRLLNSIEQQEENSAEAMDEVQGADAIGVSESMEDMLGAFADAGMLLSPLEVPEIEAEAFVDGEDIPIEDNIGDSDVDNVVEDVSDMEPDYSAPEMSETEMARLESMELDSIIEGVTANSSSIEELFNDDISDEPKAVNLSDATKTLDEQVDAGVAVTLAEGTENTSDSQEIGEIHSKKAKKEKIKKEKPAKDKSKKGGIGAAIRSIFFVSEESTAESEEAKKQGEKAAQEAKDNDARVQQEANIKETVVNEDGKKELDENQKLLKEMYGKEQEEEVAPKQSFFEKLKYRFSVFMKKSAEEDAAEDEAEAKEYEERKLAKAEKQEADKVKKEELKAEKQKKAEENKAKKAAKQKEKEKKKKAKPEPKPGDILKIKPQSMLLFILFVVGAIMLIIMLNDTISYNSAVSKAKAGMENGDYAKAYEALAGLELKGNDVVMFEQASVIMYVERHYESFENYKLMGRPVEALDALITGLVRYETYYMRACDLGVDKQLIAIREKILLKITEEYGISSSEAIALANLSITNYTQYYIKVEAYGKAR